MIKKIALILLITFSFACDSNCISCHPKLKELYKKENPYYKEHSFLQDCTKCHKNHKSTTSQCGADCFDCHSRKKLINTPILEHQKLRSCTKCHKNTLQEIIPQNNINNFLNLK